MSGEVQELLHDENSKDSIEAILTSLVDTDFASDRLREILSDTTNYPQWRVGEAIAEAFLSCQRSCYFPWPISRDQRKSGSSLPGADLVGFATDSEGDRLAFGEVKTSSEARHPPRAMYGRTGLKKQLENLRDSVAVRDDLFTYLAHRVQSADWRPRFEAAGRRYLKNASDVQLFGFLIRDVEPNSLDLNARVQSLGQDCPCGTTIELLALYLPVSSLNAIGQGQSLPHLESGT